MIPVSQWAGESAWIPREGNAHPGRCRLSRMPHESAMLDDLDRPGAREVFWMLASQAGGKTMVIILIDEYLIAVVKESIINSRDTKERALEWMRDKFIPTTKATPCMTGLLRETKERDAESTAVSRKFPGGTFKLIGAFSVGSARSTSCGNILQDEVDAYVATKEGDPCALIDRAAITFNAFKLKSSTPTLEGFSRIHDGYKRGNQEGFYVPCPICGHFQVLNFFGDEDPADPAGVEKEEMRHSGGGLKFSFTKEEHARFEIGNVAGVSAIERLREIANGHIWEINPEGDFPVRDTRRAIYVCESCHHGWTDSQRIAAYLSGHRANPPVVVNGKGLRAEWRGRAPFTGVLSRHISGMYLTIGLEKGYVSYLHQFAENFLKANAGGRETLMAWWNMFQAMPFFEKGERVAWRELMKRAEDYDASEVLPLEVVWIVWAGDVHPDRVEFIFYGWGDKDECWALEHHVEYGDFSMPAMQQRVWEWLDVKRWNHPVLGSMTWFAGTMDSGKQTKVQEVYAFSGKHKWRNVTSCKGFDSALGEIGQSVFERRYGGRRWNFNVDFLKNTVFERLKNKNPGPGYIHFPKKFESRFYVQLCSEHKMRMPNGQTKWVKRTSSARNETLDMTVYARGLYDCLRQQEIIARKSKEVMAKHREQHPAYSEKRTEPLPVGEVKQPELRIQQQPARPRMKIRIASPFSRFP